MGRTRSNVPRRLLWFFHPEGVTRTPNNMVLNRKGSSSSCCPHLFYRQNWLACAEKICLKNRTIWLRAPNKKWALGPKTARRDHSKNVYMYRVRVSASHSKNQTKIASRSLNFRLESSEIFRFWQFSPVCVTEWISNFFRWIPYKKLSKWTYLIWKISQWPQSYLLATFAVL